MKLVIVRGEEEMKVKQTEIDRLSEVLHEREWELEQRSTEVTQLDAALRERCSEAEQRYVIALKVIQ